MEIKQKNWGKTILTAYTYLGRLCDSIDEIIKESAVNSFYSHGYGWESNSVMGVSKKIIGLSERKIKYINLKVVTEKALKKMPKQLSKLIILKFIHQINTDEIICILNLSRRTLFRFISKALTCFMNELSVLGYTSEKLEIEYFNDNFINSIYKLLSKETKTVIEQVDVLSKEKFTYSFLQEIGAFV